MPNDSGNTAQANVIPHSLLTDFDIDLFKSGKHFRLYEKLGAHVMERDGQSGTYFAVWAPNAKKVSVVGDFNHWNPDEHVLHVRWDSSGIWEGFIPGVRQGNIYKYKIFSNQNDQVLEKGDPFAKLWEVPPKTASVVWDWHYDWKDNGWLENRAAHNALDKPFSVYEVHMGSWKRKFEQGNESLSYGELATELVNYVKESGFTHVEFLPVMEHPFFGSWGYQTTGYFAPSARYGTPQEFMLLMDKFHEAGIGVILDWVPSHFPDDSHGLIQFDGTALYEHADPKKGFHPDWESYIFNYGRNEIRSFLISNAIFWLDKYHADGLRVDAVASMLYLDYSRKEGEWIPNQFGGRENLEAISFLKALNEEIYKSFPTVQIIAEESTAWPMVSRPTSMGGLGFGMKWMMGWMHDTLEYFSKDPVYRKYHQFDLTFSLNYAFTENFVLPLSHDEVVHGKGALIQRMPGDEWQRFANLRLLFTYMFTHPGTKLLFMGAEIGQTSEWRHDQSLDWHLLEHPPHQGVLQIIKDLNGLYRSEPALYEKGFDGSGFEWIDLSDHENSILIYLRKGHDPDQYIIVAANLTPTPHYGYQFGVPHRRNWREILSSDDHKYWGSGMRNEDILEVRDIPLHGKPQSIQANLPPLAAIVLKGE